MKADEMTVEKFDSILPELKFSLLQYPQRHAFQGAGPRCLVADYGDGVGEGITVLFENGSYEIFGYDDDEDLEYGSWAVTIDAEYGDREQII